jgi:hypothetical protein
VYSNYVYVYLEQPMSPGYTLLQLFSVTLYTVYSTCIDMRSVLGDRMDGPGFETR